MASLCHSHPMINKGLKCWFWTLPLSLIIFNVDSKFLAQILVNSKTYDFVFQAIKCHPSCLILSLKVTWLFLYDILTLFNLNNVMSSTLGARLRSFIFSDKSC